MSSCRGLTKPERRKERGGIVKKGAILCVDDEPIILLSLVQELKRTFGNELAYERAMNAEAALTTIEALEKEGVRVILIISDWLMPGIKGDEFLRIVHERYPDIRAIMISGNADPQEMREFAKLESLVAVFGKPWDRKRLAEAIRVVLRGWNIEPSDTDP